MSQLSNLLTLHIVYKNFPSIWLSINLQLVKVLALSNTGDNFFVRTFRLWFSGIIFLMDFCELKVLPI